MPAPPTSRPHATATTNANTTNSLDPVISACADLVSNSDVSLALVPSNLTSHLLRCWSSSRTHCFLTILWRHAIYNREIPWAALPVLVLSSGTSPLLLIVVNYLSRHSGYSCLELGLAFRHRSQQTESRRRQGGKEKYIVLCPDPPPLSWRNQSDAFLALNEARTNKIVQTIRLGGHLCISTPV